jgi:hypothetical protein
VQGEAWVFSGRSPGSVGRWLMGRAQACVRLAGFVAGRVQCVQCVQWVGWGRIGGE